MKTNTWLHMQWYAERYIWVIKRERRCFFPGTIRNCSGIRNDTVRRHFIDRSQDFCLGGIDKINVPFALVWTPVRLVLQSHYFLFLFLQSV